MGGLGLAGAGQPQQLQHHLAGRHDHSVRDRPDCETLLDGDAQRAWLVDYAGDFLTTLFAGDAGAVDEAKARMGLDVTAPAPDTLYGLPARVATLAPAANRQTVMIPAQEEELVTNLLGGMVTVENATTHFCPKAFYSAWSMPGSEPCRRNYITVPGQPAHAVVSWEQPGAALRFALPDGAGDLSGFATLSLRAAVDPASPLNATGEPQAFSVKVTDRAGNSATVQTRPDEPALAFPAGEMRRFGHRDRLFHRHRAANRHPPALGRLRGRRSERPRRDRADLRPNAQRYALRRRP